MVAKEVSILAFKVKQIRLERGLTVPAVASAMGVSQQAVGKWERGEAMPRAELLPKLAKLLDCKIGDMFDESDA